MTPGVAQPGQSVVVTPPQQVVLAQPQAAVVSPASVNSYIVLQAPPAPQPEAVLPRPSSSHVWVAGYWTWQNNRYAWMAGHWEVPPYANATWVTPRSEVEGGAIRFYEGYWN